MSSRTIAQDNGRETLMANILGLTIQKSRMGLDAKDELGRPFELKSSTKHKNAVSTSRDLNIEKVKNIWTTQYWAFATGHEYQEETGKRFYIKQFYMVHPQFLMDDFEKILAPLYMREKIIQELIPYIEMKQWSPDIKKELNHLLKRGMTLNDPKLSLVNARRHGIKISFYDIETARRERAEYTDSYPLSLPVNKNKELSVATDFFDFE